MEEGEPQPSLTTSSGDAVVDLGHLEQLLSADDYLLDSPRPSSSSTSVVAHTTSFDLETLLSCENPWRQLAAIASSSSHNLLSGDKSCLDSPMPDDTLLSGLQLPKLIFLILTCIGVVLERSEFLVLAKSEFLTTRRTFTFNFVTIACVALQALRSAYDSSIPRTKSIIHQFNGSSYKDGIPEVLRVLRSACTIHELPLAQTWVTCAQQGKSSSRHSNEKYRHCISTLDAACYVNDLQMQKFHEACSEHHLLRGQGVAGKAFTTNQPCFQPNIGFSTELEYPLFYLAKIFSLKGAVAIRLRCKHTGTVDFVLEFFLPTDCEVPEKQKALLDSLWGTVRSLCTTLRMVTDKEMKDEAKLEMNKLDSLGAPENKGKRRKRMARRADVWERFTEIKVGDTAVKARCNHCGLELCCDSKIHGTSSLRSHLKRCKSNPDSI